MNIDYTKIVEALTRKDWQSASEHFADIMEQKVAARLAEEKRGLHEAPQAGEISAASLLSDIKRIVPDATYDPKTKEVVLLKRTLKRFGDGKCPFHLALGSFERTKNGIESWMSFQGDDGLGGMSGNDPCGGRDVNSLVKQAFKQLRREFGKEVTRWAPSQVF